MQYAFRVYAANFGHRVVESGSREESRTFYYGPSQKLLDECHAVKMPARYAPRDRGAALPTLSRLSHAGEKLYLFHGIDPVTQTPDWLGEIFEWLSSSHERSIPIHDSVGRIPDSAMIFSQQGISSLKPQASMLMARLEQVLRGKDCENQLPKAPSPIPNADHLVVSSHDIDFYFTNRKSALQRLVKNLGVSLAVYKSWEYFVSNSSMLFKMLAGGRVGDYIPALVERLEALDSHSTLFVVPIHGHRRDPNYALAELAPQLADAAKKGFSIEIHGSYNSIIENHGLNPEVQAFHAATGQIALGSRQHWLRFDDAETLFQAVEDAGLLFDSSMGFTDSIGFRNGACFAFPPYDFKNEKPHTFLEIPLAIMDGGLFEASRRSGISPQILAEQVLTESRRHGWGGISVLWHNPLEALSVPEEINRVFWRCLETQKQFNEKWVSTDQFVAMSLSRYQDAGLLKDARLSCEEHYLDLEDSVKTQSPGNLVAAFSGQKRVLNDVQARR